MGNSTKTKFDLEATIQAWRDRMHEAGGLNAEEVDELECHLRDAMNTLVEPRLSDEEAFAVAQMRLGAPHSVAREFERADPARVWLGRLKWMLIGWLGIAAYGKVIGQVIQTIRTVRTGLELTPIANEMLLCLSFLPHLTLVAAIMYGLKRHGHAFNSALERLKNWVSNRPMTTVICGVVILIILPAALQLVSNYFANRNHGAWRDAQSSLTSISYFHILFSVIWPLIHYGTIAALIYWLHARGSQDRAAIS